MAMKPADFPAVLYVLVLLIGAVAVVVPFWSEGVAEMPVVCNRVEMKTTRGIWMQHQTLQIADDNMTQADNGGWKSLDGKRIKAVRGLMLAGLSLVVIYMLCRGVDKCCCSSGKNEKNSKMYYVWSALIGGILMGSAVLVFRFNVFTEDQGGLSWGFWMAVASAAVCFLTGLIETIVTVCTYCRTC